MANDDAIIIAFPLFTYTLPGAPTRLLEDFHSYLARGGKHPARVKVYEIVNCGFPDPRITNEAIRVIRNFCARTGLS